MKIYFINFWDGFHNIPKGEPLNKWFFANLIGGQPCEKFEEADIVVTSVFGSEIPSGKPIIQFSGEAYYWSSEKFKVNLLCEKSGKNIVCVPFAIAYLQSCPRVLKGLTTPRHTGIPEKFCCFIVSNPNCIVRNRMFQALSKLGRVDSLGRAFNNVGGAIEGDWTGDKILEIIAQYKFIICFENKWVGNYVTEKIVNPFLVNCVPIYWGSEHVLHIFNESAFIYLKQREPTDGDIQSVCQKIIEIDKDDTLYLKIRRELPLKDGKLPREYTLGQIKKRIRELIN